MAIQFDDIIKAGLEAVEYINQQPQSEGETCAACNVPFCAFCGICHNSDCGLTGKKVASKSELVSMKYLSATTQKIRGYVAISDVLNVPRPFRVIMDETDIAPVVAELPVQAAKWFVRPCPIRPRHGFVESRAIERTPYDPVAFTNTIKAIFHEARLADPQAELLIAPAVQASHNVILTPSRMAIGTGNDGATAGKQSTIFPLAGVPFAEIDPYVLGRAGVAPAEDPYIEVVIRNHARGYSLHEEDLTGKEIFFTQLRAGVKIPPAVEADFVPERMVVQGVLEASGDLLEWERQVQDIKPGAVVYHLGGTLVSHYGVHCIYHNIPIFTSRIPVVGEVIEQTLKPEWPDAKAVVRGLGIGVSDSAIALCPNVDQEYEESTKHRCTLSCNQATTLLLVAAHNVAAMGGDNGYWIGLSTALMLRLGMAASHGEARHKDSAKVSRNSVYNLALNDFFGSRETIGNAQWRFENLKWDGSFGGKAWAKCTESLFRLDAAAQKVLKEQSQDAVKELIDALHNSINQAHNGGWWLNKFVQQRAFDKSAVQSVESLAAAAPAILTTSQLQSTVDDEIAASKWRDAGVPEITSGLTITKKPLKKNPNHPDEEGDCDCDDMYCKLCYPDSWNYCDVCDVDWHENDGHDCPDTEPEEVPDEGIPF